MNVIKKRVRENWDKKKWIEKNNFAVYIGISTRRRFPR